MNSIVRALGLTGIFGIGGWFVGAHRNVSTSVDAPVDARTSSSIQPHLPDGNVSIMQLLSRYAPDRVEEAALVVQSQGRSLDDLVDTRRVAPWERAEPKLRRAIVECGSEDKRFLSRLGWGNDQQTPDVDFRAAAYNPTGAALTDKDLESVRTVARDFDSKLVELIEVENVFLQQALQARWERGEFEAIPVISLPAKRAVGQRTILTRYAAIDDWTVSMSLHTGDAPPYDDAVRNTDAVRAQRRAAVRDRIAQILQSH
jgi:hypothetical protein